MSAECEIMEDKIVEDIVMRKYQHQLEQILNKISQRHQRRTCRKFPKDTRKDDSFTDYIPAGVGSSDSNLSTLTSSFSHYNERNLAGAREGFRTISYFLTATKQSNSVNTSNISTLISQPGLSSLQKTLTEENFTSLSDIASVDLFGSKCDTDFAVNNEVDVLLSQIHAQNEIIRQLSKALHYCRNMKKLHFTSEHIDAEKLLRIAMVRRDLFFEQVAKKTNPKYDQLRVGLVRIEAMKFFIHDKDRRDNQYFFCTLNCGSQLQYSDIAQPNENWEISFKNRFVFSNVPSNFRIYFNLFSMKIGKKLKKDKCALNNNFSAHIPLQTPLFTLFSSLSFKLGQLVENGAVIHLAMSTVSVQYQASVDLLAGYLTTAKLLNNHCLKVHTHWCLLEGYEMKMWNGPLQHHRKPLKIINLDLCTNIGVLKRKPRVVFLEIDETDIYLLSTNFEYELRNWETLLKALF